MTDLTRSQHLSGKKKMRERHPEVAREFVTRLEAGVETQYLGGAATAARNLAGTHGFEPPSWTALAFGAHPPSREPDDYEPGAQRLGWQHEASSRVELQFRELQLMSGLSEGGSGADEIPERTWCWGGFLDNTVHIHSLRLEPQLFRVLLLRRLRLPPSLSPVASAGVAVSLTPLAITVQHAHGLECWGGAGLLWKVPLLAFVAKQGAE